MRHAIKGLYAVTPDTGDTRGLLDQVSSALAGGAVVVQYRNKGSDAALRAEQAAALVAACRTHGAVFIVNDDIELARAIGADGVHLGRDDANLADARAALGPDAIIGISCYDDLRRAERAAAGGADYVAFGSFFPSRVKPAAVRASLELLQAARHAVHVPKVAIGGITLDNAPQLVAAGADALAVISALFDVPDVAATARRFAQLFECETA